MIIFLCTRAKISVINLFNITRFYYFEVNYHSYYWGKENCLLYRGLSNIEVPDSTSPKRQKM